jgi:hypothetical protein
MIDDRGVVRMDQSVSEELLLSLVLPHQESPHCIHDQSHGSMHLLPTCCDQHSEYSTVAADHTASDRRLGRDKSHLFTVVWSKLLDHEGKQCSYSDIHKDVNDLILFYADPRRMTDEFKLVLSQFDRIPNRSQLRVATVLINCDDVNDHRKFKKKNPTGGGSRRCY